MSVHRALAMKRHCSLPAGYDVALSQANAQRLRPSKMLAQPYGKARVEKQKQEQGPGQN